MNSTVPSLRKTAYERFLNALRDKELVLGKSYTQAELCDQLGLSTNPLQAALKVLESEGFVDIKARAGITVKRPDLTEFRECHQLRRILELAAIEEYASTQDPDGLKSLRAAVVEHRERAVARVAPEDLAGAYDDIELRLHGGIVGALGNATITRIHETNMNKVRMMRRSSLKLSYEHFITTADEHLAIIDAALNRDSAGATQALQHHLMAALQRAVMTNLHTLEM